MLASTTSEVIEGIAECVHAAGTGGRKRAAHTCAVDKITDEGGKHTRSGVWTGDHRSGAVL